MILKLFYDTVHSVNSKDYIWYADGIEKYGFNVYGMAILLTKQY